MELKSWNAQVIPQVVIYKREKNEHAIILIASEDKRSRLYPLSIKLSHDIEEFGGNATVKFKFDLKLAWVA